MSPCPRAALIEILLILALLLSLLLPLLFLLLLLVVALVLVLLVVSCMLLLLLLMSLEVLPGCSHLRKAPVLLQDLGALEICSRSQKASRLGMGLSFQHRDSCT